MNDTSVLIVGAGPTGLVLALFLAKAGVKPRIIDKRSGPGEASRAMGVQARTLEFYRQIGIADEIVDKGIKIETIQMRSHHEVMAQIDIKDYGEGLSPYPFLLSFPQDEHEKLLVEKLTLAGVQVEWQTELMSLLDTDSGVTATIREMNASVMQCTADYVCGCDGAHSVVRHDLGLDFVGAAYERTFFVADVRANGAAVEHGAFNLCLAENSVLLILPVRTTGMYRLIGAVPEEIANKPDLTFEDVRPSAEAASDVHVQAINWFSSYRVSHRVANHFRVGRKFLLGDAGHIHSPVGGQGMNTGIGDAVNLAWKLAAVISGRADSDILETYEPERIAFARSLVSTTDKIFQLATGTTIGHQLFRESILPHIAPFALGFSYTRTAMFKLVSQIRINYHGSELSEGSTGGLEGGDRLPWIQIVGEEDNFVPLRSLDWQIHIYGDAEPVLLEKAKELKIEVQQFGWTNTMKHAGLENNALYVIRPDGYVGLADKEQDVVKLEAYLSKFRIVNMTT
jgi:2-polyprenyl-6-methoxyphenol hydroxylase-like FAD-dependent oxidoreductase